MRNKYRAVVSCCAFVLVLGACSREAERTADAAPAAAAPPSVADIQLGSAVAENGRVAQADTTVAPGEPVIVSMNVEELSNLTPVTVHWMGPDGGSVGYEVQFVKDEMDLLSFTNEQTQDWRAGQYRAEIWVNDRKVAEQPFTVTPEQA